MLQVYSIFKLLGGLGLFLLGMKQMGDGLELIAGLKLRSLIEKLTRNKYMGALVGTLVTGIIQSSSATTVMVVGFVNAGLMTLSQAVGVVFGANIGTTVTGIMIAINLTKVAPILVFAGVIMMYFLVKPKHRKIGQVISGFGMIFLGIDFMSRAMKPIANSNFFKDIIVSFSNPLIGLFVGILFTATIQSSSASLGVLQALSMSGAIRLSQSVFVIYGQNIGTCVTAMLSSIGTTKTAKRTAVLHLLFNTFGAILFTVITLCFPFVSFIEKIFPGSALMQISVTHVLFNVVCAAIFLPMSEYLIKIACKIIPGEDEEKSGPTFTYVDSRILSAPPIAVAQAIKEVLRMGKLAKNNFELSVKEFISHDRGKVSEIYENEKTINFLNKRLTEFLVKINTLNISLSDRKILGSLFHVISDFERIGDHSKNICSDSENLEAIGERMPIEALHEIQQLYGMVVANIDKSMEILETRSKDIAMIKSVMKTENIINEKTELFKNNSIERLKKGECSAEIGTIYMDLLNNLERVADHCTNVAFSVFEKSKIRLGEKQKG